MHEPDPRPSPVDRARRGSKHHLLPDSRGVPLAISLPGGHRNDVTQLLPLIDGVGPVHGKVGRPRQRADRVLADRGYDHDKYRRELRKRGVKPVSRGAAAFTAQVWAASVGSSSGRSRTCTTCVRLRTRYERDDQPELVSMLLGRRAALGRPEMGQQRSSRRKRRPSPRNRPLTVADVQVVATPSIVPVAPGVDGWYFESVPPGVPTDGLTCSARGRAGDVNHSDDRVGNLAALLTDALWPTPPVNGLATWQDALAGELHLFFEVSLPSPPVYRRWLHDHIGDRALIPYVREAAAAPGARLEGSTHVDALLLSETTGFAVLFEAKVISDADAKVSFDVMRNQLARNIDVMLDANPGLKSPLRTRRPDQTCFVLLTPEVFKRYPHSRLYGSLLPSYQGDPAALARDLPHRDQSIDDGEPIDWPALSRRLGWRTFEDCERITPGACSWLTRDELGHLGT